MPGDKCFLAATAISVDDAGVCHNGKNMRNLTMGGRWCFLASLSVCRLSGAETVMVFFLLKTRATNAVRQVLPATEGDDQQICYISAMRRTDRGDRHGNRMPYSSGWLFAAAGGAGGMRIPYIWHLK